ncbi:ABC transporter permease protein [Candidatus Rhodobacter oscarellae]|uniref:ABC transporter permease protein n=1 Tax=Candidatus Rhodobacter oscarellae TaxID=1675527 RepID=A0A0J9H0V2_9RHOB|nr:ABC transporter permease [Candidatus Rhodobacter lobularis]KMW59373.1 ABC transporter permease protein [Candidatus Rhodobacter lobularis]
MSWFSRPATDTQITHGRRLWLYALAAVIMILLVIPTLIVVPMSFSDSQYLEFPPSNWSLRWYEEYLGSRKWMRATMTSVQVGVLTMLVATPLGTMAAYALFVSRHRLTRAIFLLLITPMIVPVILIAIGTFYAYGRMGMNNTIAGLVLAHAALALPLVIIVVTAGLRSYDLNQEQVARSLGATRSKAFFLITLPQIRFSVITAALLSFLTSFDEVIVAIFVSGGANATLTKHMFAALRDYIDPTIAAISTIMVILSSVLLLLTQFLGAKGTRD